MKIPGLKFVNNFITKDEEDNLISNIDRNPWLNELKRRVQHYGYKYDYTARKIDMSMYVGELPQWARELIPGIQNQVNSFSPDQLIINEYEPGQGISKHIDCEPCFSNTIVSLSLHSGCEIEFINIKSKDVEKIYLSPRSLLIFSNEARYEWQHCIRPRKTDLVNNNKIYRTRRISLTFRKVLI